MPSNLSREQWVEFLLDDQLTMNGLIPLRLYGKTQFVRDRRKIDAQILNDIKSQ